MQKKLILFALCAAFLSGCTDSEGKPQNFSSGFYPMYHGTPDTSAEHKAVVGLVVDPGLFYEDSLFCTGTLIHPQYVLTAAHCVNGEMYEYRSRMYVGVGDVEKTVLKKTTKISKIYSHPKYTGTEQDTSYDIAVVKLSSPIKDVTPIPVFTPEMAKKYLANSAMSKNPLKVEFSGFGRTEFDTFGTKLKFSNYLGFYCGAYNSPSSPKNGCVLKNVPTYECWYTDYTQTDYDCERIIDNLDVPYASMYYNQADGGPCSGDSGGPAFAVINNREYVVGITSFGDQYCDAFGVSTAVPDYFDFIINTAQVPLDEICDDTFDNNGDGKIDCNDDKCKKTAFCIQPESNCTDNIDNNKDGTIDCDDPTCVEKIECQPEDCQNKIDDNGNGLKDCDDPQCSDALVCQPENCANERDDNGDGNIDCNDPQCFNYTACLPEICNNHVDDNGNGQIDCEESSCINEIHCRKEICNNKFDDNGDGLVDCSDPDCASALHCTPEICNNEYDDNDNGLMDCDDPQCYTNPTCQLEICYDQLDNNGDQLADCDDPQCANDPSCKQEICTNHIDDNANGLMDCDDPQCQNNIACTSFNDFNPETSCSTTPLSQTKNPYFLLLLTLLPLALRRKFFK